MKLISVNVSLPKEIQYKGETVTTGIFKEPVQGRIRLRELNLEGDGQADLTVHGGVYQAVYVYPFEHYDYWKQKLGRQDLAYGQFGENFTAAEMREDQVHIGDIFRIGNAVVQVTQPRVPCYKLAIKMNLPQFPKLFMASGRTGFYLRVLQEDEVGAGDTIERIEIAPEKMTVQEIFHLAFRDHDNREVLEKASRLRGLSPGWHSMFAERLAAR
ncbi:MOSC domain-containing protein [candidate division KSB1 bacterium]|nr:MOSC domain-containing protein [candidate division KSB1 bacterium]